MFYFKKIISYFDYYEFGEKKKNCGHAKILVKDRKVTVEVHIKGLGSKENHMCDIYAKGREEKKLGRVVLNKGTGYYNACFQNDDMDGQGLCIFGVSGLRISMDENKYCETAWKWGELPPEYAKMQCDVEEKAAEIKTPLSEQKSEAKQELLKEQETEQSPGQKQEPVREREAEQGTEPKQEHSQAPAPEAENVPEMEDVPDTDRPLWHLHIEPVNEKAGQSLHLEERRQWQTGEAERKAEQKMLSKSLQEEGEPAWRLSVKPAGENREEKTQETVETTTEEKSATTFRQSVSPQGSRNDAVLHKTQMEETVTGTGTRQQKPAEETPLQKVLYDDKWKQLCCLYPVCHPFGDGEAYISIAPKDFVILRKEYQNLVSNSFLLHSFYNYHHVILGKAGEENDEMFYIGVPGAYLEREKKVAVMFGFEGFALSERGNKNRNRAGRGAGAIETGAFGYYMRKVEI